MADTFRSKVLTRRRFLANSAFVAGGALGAGALLEACSTSTTSTTGSSSTTLTVMYGVGEFLPPYKIAFEKANPGVKINQLEFDSTRLSAMFAAGQPPDYIRSQGAPVMPNVIARGLAADLTTYFEKSAVLKTDNLQPVNDVYRWDGKVQGQGPRYGMAKDWSQDIMLWYDKRAFDDAHVPYPSETTPLSYDELLALGKQLTVHKNGKIQSYGLDALWGWVPQGHIMQLVAQQGGSVYNADYTKADLTTPEARKAIKWYVDWAQSHIGPSPIDPETLGDDKLFGAKRLGLTMWGYWFGGAINALPADVQPHLGFLPAPVMGPNRISVCLAGTGAWIPTVSKQKDLAWKFMEYFMGGQPAVDRATSGWGIPALKSLFSKMPQTLSYQQEAFQVQQQELPYLKVLEFSPYISDDAFTSAFTAAIEPVVHGQRSLDDGIKQLNTNINTILVQGKQQVS